MRFVPAVFISSLLIGSAYAQQPQPSAPLQPHAGLPPPERLDPQHFCYAKGAPYSEGWIEGKVVCARTTEGGPLEWTPSTNRSNAPGAR